MKTEFLGRYRTADKSTKRQIQSEVVTACSPLIDRLVHDLVPARRRCVGRQVAALGCLVALEKFSGDVSFARLARRHARAEIARWKAATK
jgi:hypothetical protein